MFPLALAFPSFGTRENGIDLVQAAKVVNEAVTSFFNSHAVGDLMLVDADQRVISVYDKVRDTMFWTMTIHAF